jgi:dihydrolipoamide dehydrogenase
MADSYELIVLGGGTGGYSCALRAAGLGMSVALVEREKVGGTCLHAGCIPTKALLQAAEVAEHAQQSHDYGVNATFEGIDLDALMSYKQSIVDTNYKGLQASLKSRGVDVIPGDGAVTGPTSLTVTTDEGQRELTAERGLVLATGSVPMDLPVAGAEIDGETIINSDHALTLQRVPERPIVIGASAVGVEFASVWHGFGAEQVTVVEALDELVPREDAETSSALAKSFKRSRYDVRTGTQVTGVEKDGDAVRVTTEDGSAIEGDLLMIAIGRRPVSAEMGFEEAGASLESGHVQVDNACRAGPEGLYAIGDVVPTLGLAHASFQEGFLVAEHAAGRQVRPIDYAGVPRVYYSHPEIGSVGYTEAELAEQGIDYESTTFPFTHNARAMMMKGSGHAKVLTAADGGKVLGVHMVGPKATDLIAEGQLIYNWEALPTEVAEFIHPHPTLSEVVGEAHLALAGKPLHG